MTKKLIRGHYGPWRHDIFKSTIGTYWISIVVETNATDQLNWRMIDDEGTEYWTTRNILIAEVIGRYQCRKHKRAERKFIKERRKHALGT